MRHVFAVMPAALFALGCCGLIPQGKPAAPAQAVAEAQPQPQLQPPPADPPAARGAEPPPQPKLPGLPVLAASDTKHIKYVKGSKGRYDSEFLPICKVLKVLGPDAFQALIGSDGPMGRAYLAEYFVISGVDTSHLRRNAETTLPDYYECLGVERAGTGTTIRLRRIGLIDHNR